jgi:porin
MRKLLLLLAIIAGAITARAEENAWQKWWHSDKATGDLFGAAPVMRDNGLKIDGRWRGIYFGVIESEKGSGNAFAQELSFAAKLNLAKLLRAPGLEGLEAFGEGRWRDAGQSANPDHFVEASALFNPSRFAGGTGWRLLSFGLRYATPEVFGAKDFAMLTAGWLRPKDEFIDQPLQGLFVNKAIAVAKGLGGNIAYGGSYSAWGTTLRIKPTKWQYTKAGLFMSYPNSFASANNGLMFQGYASDPASNGLFFMGETGVTPDIGAAKLPGRYALGAYVYGQNESYDGGNKSGYYLQIDQQLLREPSTAGDEADDTVDGLTLVSAMEKQNRLSSQGLRMFSLMLFTPEYNDRYPFYFHGGLVYEGLVPQRGGDQLIVGTAFATYGSGSQPGASSTTLVEAGYRIRINDWAFVQPYAQYIASPAGTTSVSDGAILGFFLGADF